MTSSAQSHKVYIKEVESSKTDRALERIWHKNDKKIGTKFKYSLHLNSF